MTNPTIYSGSERILRAGVFCTLLDLTLTLETLSAGRCQDAKKQDPQVLL